MKTSIRQETGQVKRSFSQITPAELVTYATKISNRHQDILRFLMGLIRSKGPITIAQETIGRHIGTTRQYINRLLGQLHKDNIIIKIYRGYRLTCEYIINPLFEDPDVRSSLRSLFPSLAKTSFLTLIPSLSLISGCQDAGFYLHDNYVKIHYSNIYKDNNNRTLAFFASSSFSSGVSVERCVSKLVEDDWEAINYRGGLDATSKSYFEGIFTRTLNKKEREPMESGKKEWVDHSKVRGLRITAAGAIKLSIFPKEALEHALGRIRATKKKIEDPFRYFWWLCKDYCKEHSIIVSWSACEEQLKEQGYHKDSPGIDPKDRDNPYLMKSEKPRSTDISFLKRELPVESSEYIQSILEQARAVKIEGSLAPALGSFSTIDMLERKLEEALNRERSLAIKSSESALTNFDWSLDA